MTALKHPWPPFGVMLWINDLDQFTWQQNEKMGSSISLTSSNHSPSSKFACYTNMDTVTNMLWVTHSLCKDKKIKRSDDSHSSAKLKGKKVLCLKYTPLIHSKLCLICVLYVATIRCFNYSGQLFQKWFALYDSATSATL